MSVVVQYIRLSLAQLEKLAEEPERLWEMGTDEEYQGAELLYLDKAYESIAWVLSPLARAEADHMTRLIKNPNEKEAALARVAAINAMPVDLAFEALYGDRSHVDDRFDVGLDPPAVMSPEKVAALSGALDQISRADIERGFDREAMIHDGMNYADEDDIIEGYILPEFKRLQALYSAAAANNQVVMVVFT
jgi:hypothetical protein